MPPSHRKPGSRPSGTAFLIVAVLGVAVAVLLMVFVVRLASKPGARTTLATSTFDVPGRVFATRIAKEGPLLFQALVHDKDVWLQHLGADPKTGWIAVEARLPGEDRRCTTTFDRARRLFVDPCTGQTFPEDGAGLPHLPVTVEAKGKVSIDLRGAAQQP